MKIRDQPQSPQSVAFTSRERQMLLNHVDKLTACIGSAERLIQTPVPLTYARHTSRFLTLFCFIAPLTLVSELGIYMIPAVSLVTWSLFGILEIGMTIEEPFQRALKLELFTNTILRDYSDLMHVANISPQNVTVDTPVFAYQEPLFYKFQ